MAESGAQAALRGYRLQALFTLDRVLGYDHDAAFQLEGREDLDILQDGALTEIIQVKALDHPLTLSDLSPKKTRSFFRRVLDRGSQQSAAVVEEILACFSGFGPTVATAFESDGAERAAAVAKLQGWGYSAEDARSLIATIRLRTPDLKRHPKSGQLWTRQNRPVGGGETSSVMG